MTLLAYALLPVGAFIGLAVWLHLEHRKVTRDPEVQRRIEDARRERERQERWKSQWRKP